MCGLFFAAFVINFWLITRVPFPLRENDPLCNLKKDEWTKVLTFLWLFSAFKGCSPSNPKAHRLSPPDRGGAAKGEAAACREEGFCKVQVPGR